LKEQLMTGALLITPGDREDLLLAAMEIQNQGGADLKLTGIVLTDGLRPQPGLVRMMGDRGLPVITAAGDSYTVTAKIERMTVKTDPGDEEKIKVIQQVVAKHVDLKAIAPKGGTTKKGGAGS
jgi:BioD-like phosphotransacetylase family protein